MLSLRTCVICKSIGSLIGWENYQISWQSEQIMQHSAQILKTCRLQSNIASSAKCDSSILIYRRNNNLVHVCHVCCMNPELVLFYAHKSIQKTNKQISKTFPFENHSYVYPLVHYEVRRSAIFRSKRGNQTCKPDGHQT